MSGVIIEDLFQWDIVVNDKALLIEGMRLKTKLKLSFRDSLIIAAAKSAKVNVILSEDLAAGQLYEGIRVSNPFDPIEA